VCESIYLKGGHGLLDHSRIFRGTPAKGEPLDAKQAVALLEAARGDRFEALYVLYLLCGLRQSEALALRWQDPNLDTGNLRVSCQLQRVRGGGGYEAVSTRVR
jgi:integrase